MQNYSGTGSFRFEDGAEIAGSFDVTVVGNGDMSARFYPATSPFAIWDRIGQKGEFKIASHDGSAAEARRVFVSAIGECVLLKIPFFMVRGIPRKRDATISRYQLTNCVFSMGSHLTPYPRGGGSWNAIEIGTETALLRIVKLDSYDETLRELKAQKAGGVTAILEVSGPAEAASCDAWANAVCNLLSFATKNTVRWTSRERSGGGDTSEIEYYSPGVYEIRPLRSIIPDMPEGGRPPLHTFLQSALPRYAALDKELGLESTVGWLLEAEFSMPIQPKFVLSFIAIERLRSRLLKGQSGKVFLSLDFPSKVDGELGTKLVEAIEAAVGPLDEETRAVLPKKLKELNRPTIAASIDALCRHYQITAPRPEVMRLRNRLTHAGDLGDFDFYGALDLYIELSHILDLCLLKALGYSGVYRHMATGWELRPLA